MAVAPFPLPAGLPVDPALLPTLLALLPMGVIYYTPVLDAAGTLIDLDLAYLNPAAQRITQLPAQPATTYRRQFPTTQDNGAWEFHRRSWLAQEPQQFQFYYDADGYNNYFRVTAQRLGEGLLTIFTDTSDEGRSQVEVALRASQAGEQARTRQVEQLNETLEARVAERTHQLQEQQALVSSILGQLPAAVGTFHGPEHRFTYFNEQYQQITHNRAVDGVTVAEALPEAAEQGFIALLDQVYRTGEPFVASDFPIMLRQPDGSMAEHYLSFTYSPLREYQGPVNGILAFAVDVTEQVRARQQNEALQAELLAAAQRQAAEREGLYHVLEQAPVGVTLLRGPQLRFDYVNPTFQRLFPGRPLLGLDVATAFPEGASQGFVALLQQVYQTGTPYFGNEVPFTEAPVGDQPPHTIYFNFSYQAVREGGHIVGLCAFAFDVTAAVMARREQDRQRQLLATVFAQAPAAVWVTQGPAYVFELVNAPMAAMLGHAPAQLLGRPFFEAFPEFADQGLPELLAQAWTSGEPVAGDELFMRLPYRGPEAVGYFAFVYQPLRDEYGQVTRMACVTQEVTSQVLARQQVQRLNEELAVINEELTVTNEELHASNRQLTRTNVDLDTFVYTASHDLKAPITNIESLVLALRNTLPAPVQQDALIANLLDLLDQTTARFQFTIAQLTDLSKLQLAHAGPAEPVNLAAVVEAVRLDLMPALESAAVQLTVEVAPALVISFSPANLRSTIYNLLSNAVKYRAPDRPAQVIVRASRIGLGVVLEVQDNGLGLNAHQQSRLFGLFQRLHTHVEGTGVGLYITKRLVENGGGRIAVASQPNVGTTFTVTLPT